MLTWSINRSSRHSLGAASSVEPVVAAARVKVSWKGRPWLSPGISTGQDCNAGRPISATERIVP